MAANKRSRSTGRMATIEPAEANGNGKRTKRHIQPQVMDKIRSAKGIPVSVTELSVTLGVPKASVQHAVLQLMKSMPQIEVVTKGQLWKWNDTPRSDAEKAQSSAVQPESSVSTDTTYVQVGEDMNGQAIVRKVGGDMALYKVYPL